MQAAALEIPRPARQGSSWPTCRLPALEIDTVTTTEALAIEYVEPGILEMAPYNPRKVTDDALQRLAKLLDAHGFVDPVIARREDNLLIGGHQRLKANALCKKPAEKVPVVYLDGVSDAQAKALNIALNNPKAQGEWDFPKLADLLQDIDTGEFDIPELTGFAENDIANMMHGMDEFEPVDSPDTRLDEKTMARCPKCGNEFRP